VQINGLVGLVERPPVLICAEPAWADSLILLELIALAGATAFAQDFRSFW